MNEIYVGDCLNVLKKIESDSVDLIYLDPPFFTQKEQSLTTRDGKKYYNFSDQWPSISDYIENLHLRLQQCHRVLKPTGSLFLHCDKTAVHYLKITLDKIFQAENFQSEIIWSYRRWSNAKKGLMNNHQNILFYSKTESFKFNSLFDDYSPATNVDQIVQLRARDNRKKSVYKTNLNGAPLLCTEKKGVPIGDVWDIPYLNPKAQERVGYPTQKPIILIEKIIQLVTNEGDLVLDPYCGSGTSLVAAQLLRRKFIGIDKNREAVKLANSRLKNPIKSQSKLLNKGRASYERSDVSVKNIVRDLKATLVQRNKGIDGLISDTNQILPFKVVLKIENIISAAEQISKSAKKNKYDNKALFISQKINKKKAQDIEKKYQLIIFKNLNELSKKLIKKSLQHD